MMITKGSCPSAVCFVKKSPEEAKRILEVMGYAGIDRYTSRYMLTVPSSIRRSMLDRLVAQGLVGAIIWDQ